MATKSLNLIISCECWKSKGLLNDLNKTKATFIQCYIHFYTKVTFQGLDWNVNLIYFQEEAYLKVAVLYDMSSKEYYIKRQYGNPLPIHSL